MAFKVEIEDKMAIKESDKIPPPVLLKAFLKFSSQPLVILFKCALCRFCEIRDSSVASLSQNDKLKKSQNLADNSLSLCLAYNLYDIFRDFAR